MNSPELLKGFSEAPIEDRVTDVNKAVEMAHADKIIHNIEKGLDYSEMSEVKKKAERSKKIALDIYAEEEVKNSLEKKSPEQRNEDTKSTTGPIEMIKCQSSIEELVRNDKGDVIGYYECFSDPKNHYRTIKEVYRDADKNIERTVKFKYDSTGDLKKTTRLDKDGNVFQTETVNKLAEDPAYHNIMINTFDTNGKNIETKFIDLDTQSPKRSVFHREYDSKGREVKQYHFGYGLTKTETIYDDENKTEKTIEKEYRSNGGLEKILEMTRDGRKFIYIEKNPDGSIKRWEELIHDRKGNIVETITKDKDGKVESRFEHVNDSRGNHIKSTEKTPSGQIVEIVERKFDRNGEVTSCVTKDEADNIIP